MSSTGSPGQDRLWGDTMVSFRQSCQARVLFNALLNLYAEHIQKIGLDAEEGGVTVGGRNINIRYADDTILLAESSNALR